MQGMGREKKSMKNSGKRRNGFGRWRNFCAGRGKSGKTFPSCLEKRAGVCYDDRREHTQRRARIDETRNRSILLREYMSISFNISPYSEIFKTFLQHKNLYISPYFPIKRVSKW